MTVSKVYQIIFPFCIKQNCFIMTISLSTICCMFKHSLFLFLFIFAVFSFFFMCVLLEFNQSQWIYFLSKLCTKYMHNKVFIWQTHFLYILRSRNLVFPINSDLLYNLIRNLFPKVWLFWVVLLWMWLSKCPCGIGLNPFSICQWVVLLGHEAD